MPDTPQRIACDTSQKVPIRFGETIKSYLADPARDAGSLKAIPLAIAGWLRYLLGVDDKGEAFEISPDPLLPRLQEALAGITLGQPATAEGKLDALLADATLFATDLTKTPLAEKIRADFAAMLAGPGAVRKALQSL